MDRLYINRCGNNYLCIVNYSSYASFLCADRLHRYLPLSTKRTSGKLLLREMAKVFFVDIFKRTLPNANFRNSSVSHGRNESVMMVNEAALIHSVGIDIEFIEKAKAPRPFILDYLEKCGGLSGYDTPDNLLCTTIFSCMESLYKALCAISMCTFDINDYLLVEHKKRCCVFRYVGKIQKFKERQFICNCYYICRSVLTVVLLDECLKSVRVDDLLYERMNVRIPG